MTLNEKHIAVLGGSSGIGFAVAQAAAKEGAQLTIASSRKASIEAALVKLPGGTHGHAVDLKDEASIQALFGKVGALDHLVFTAGESLQLAKLADVDLAAAREFFALRYWGAYAAAKHAAPLIRSGGSITFTSGLAGQRPHSGWSVASSICSAMEGLTRALAVELAPIRVNIVSPGVVKSPLWSNMSEADRQGLYKAMAETLPLRHVGEPEEVAQAYLYLMKQSYGTGQRVTVDGGGALV
ncbi:MAG TPA: SDR family oxidoreductase [Rhizomicrobium sp.]|jgi:NAD(P)-dependent dehydrogenase (short-subunit alcohol dehydrogenase family)|nr:SDR family oxidoreductase [Rhizomicrobium sp.]